MSHRVTECVVVNVNNKTSLRGYALAAKVGLAFLEELALSIIVVRRIHNKKK